MSDRMKIRHLDIGLIDLRWADDWKAGATYYTVAAHRAKGVVTASIYDIYDTDALLEPDGWRIQLDYGRADVTRRCHPDRAKERPDLLTVNNVPLYGYEVVNPAQLRQEPLSRWFSPTWAPDRTRERTAAVLTAVAGHWITRDPHFLAFRLHASARQSQRFIAGRQAEAERQRTRLAEARAKLAAAEAAAVDAEVFAAVLPAVPAVVDAAPVRAA